MKKLILLATLLISVPAIAQDCRWGVDHKHASCYYTQHRHSHNKSVIIQRNSDWVGPALVTIIGGAVVADIITRNRNETVIVQPNVTHQVEQCSPWIETQNPDGTITRTRTCTR